MFLHRAFRSACASLLIALLSAMILAAPGNAQGRQPQSRAGSNVLVSTPLWESGWYPANGAEWDQKITVWHDYPGSGQETCWLDVYSAGSDGQAHLYSSQNALSTDGTCWGIPIGEVVTDTGSNTVPGG